MGMYLLLFGLMPSDTIRLKGDKKVPENFKNLRKGGESYIEGINLISIWTVFWSLPEMSGGGD